MPTALDLDRELQSVLAPRIDRLRQLALAEGVLLPAATQRTDLAIQLALISDFAFDALNRQAITWKELLSAIASNAPPQERFASLQTIAADYNADVTAMHILRKARLLEQVRLIARDAMGVDSIEQTLQASSDFADASVQAALDYLMPKFTERFGLPRSKDGDAQSLCVFGLGKLGGGELNFSSDIDLIFAFPEAGQTDGARALDNEAWFARLGQKLIPLLSDVTSDGFVHRVDMRLRPFGSAGRLVLSFAGLEHYYQTEGRDWERYAWIKARCVAGDVKRGAACIESLRPFVYRKYLDFTAIDGLRAMKAMIDIEVEKKEMHDNLKLGPGGIREIEFMVQLAQLIRGGREPSLRTPSLFAALNAAIGLGHFSADEGAQLHACYRFLRRLENRVQMLGDQQTHALPDDPLQRKRIAFGLGYDSMDAFESNLQEVRQTVSNLFAQTLASQQVSSTKPSKPDDWQSWWQALSQSPQRDGIATAAPFDSAAIEAVHGLIHGANLRARSDDTKARIDRLMPRVLSELANSSQPSVALRRVVNFIQTVAGRPSYLALLNEYPAARARVLDVFARAGWLAERVLQSPVLLDELLDARRSNPHRLVEDMVLELQRRHKQIVIADDEEWLVAVQEERDAAQFRLGLAFLDQTIDAVAVARINAEIAQRVLQLVLERSRRDVSKRHPDAIHCPFAIIAYGSLGALELGFSSDLDLVFLFGVDAEPSDMNSLGDLAEADVESANTSRGEASHGNALNHEVMASLASRLAQRVLHWLNTPTRAGRLYEVDMRLRPDGSKGLLVTSVAAFADYQLQRAWLWEHQALLRAMPVTGSCDTFDAFARVRVRALRQTRDAQAVGVQIRDMRVRWRQERDRSRDDAFDLKQGEGGLVDFEFLVQAQVLRHAHQFPDDLRLPSDAAGLIDLLQLEAKLTAPQAMALRDAHQALLEAALRCNLDGQPRVTARSPAINAARATVIQAWRDAGLDASP